jgi:hypothetical protein
VHSAAPTGKFRGPQSVAAPVDDWGQNDGRNRVHISNSYWPCFCHMELYRRSSRRRHTLNFSPTYAILWHLARSFQTDLLVKWNDEASTPKGQQGLVSHYSLEGSCFPVSYVNCSPKARICWLALSSQNGCTPILFSSSHHSNLTNVHTHNGWKETFIRIPFSIARHPKLDKRSRIKLKKITALDLAKRTDQERVIAVSGAHMHLRETETTIPRDIRLYRNKNGVI